MYSAQSVNASPVTTTASWLILCPEDIMQTASLKSRCCCVSQRAHAQVRRPQKAAYKNDIGLLSRHTLRHQHVCSDRVKICSIVVVVGVIIHAHYHHVYLCFWSKQLKPRSNARTKLTWTSRPSCTKGVASCASPAATSQRTSCWLAADTAAN